MKRGKKTKAVAARASAPKIAPKSEARTAAAPAPAVPVKRLLVYLGIYLLWIAASYLLTSGLQQQGSWLDSWMKWDADWYSRIWHEGYRPEDPRALVFPPGYPMIAGFLSTLLPIGFDATGVLLNALCFFLGTFLAAEFVGKRFAIPPVLIFVLALSAPASYFVFTTYSDALFYLLFWGAIVLMHSESKSLMVQVSRVGLLLLIPWVRITGYALAAWLLLRRWSAAALLLSLVGWLGFNWFLAGDPLYFLKAQQLFAMPQGNIIDGFLYSFAALTTIPQAKAEAWTNYLQFHVLPALYFVGLATAGIWLCVRKQWMLGLALLAVLVMSHNQSFWRSAVRYDLPLIPLLLVPATTLFKKNASRERVIAGAMIFGVVIALQFALQIYFANLFKSGLWGF